MVSVEEADKKYKTSKELVLTKYRDLFSRYTQITSLPGGEDTRQRDKHKRNINLPTSGKYR